VLLQRYLVRRSWFLRQRLLLVSLLQRQLLLLLLVVLALMWLLVVVFGRVNVVGALGHDRVEPVMAVGRVVDRPYGTVGLHQAVRPFDHVTLPVLPLALQVTRVQVLDAVVEMIVGLALRTQNMMKTIANGAGLLDDRPNAGFLYATRYSLKLKIHIRLR